MGERFETWLIESRLNPVGLLRMPWPAVDSGTARVFDELLESTPDGAVVDYSLDQPKWVFLHQLVRSGYLLHGSNEPGIAEFRTRRTFDAHQQPIDAVFASDDAIWPLYFAVVRRDGLAHGYINWCLHVRGESRYVFSIGRDPRADESWTDGTVYVLPGETFRATPASRELTSAVAVAPRARLPVAPDDFPFRSRTMEHGKGATPSSVMRRMAFTRHGRIGRGNARQVEHG